MSGNQKRKRLSILAVLLAVTAAGAVAGGHAAQKKESARRGEKEGRIAVADGVELFYRRFGDSPDFIIFLHGGPGLSMTHGGMALIPLGRRHSLILYDQRGGGRSTLVQDPALLTAAADVRDLEELRKHFGAEKV